jgi:hypothetical protein
MEKNHQRFRETYDKILAINKLPTHQEVLELIQFSEQNFKEDKSAINRELFGVFGDYLFARKNFLGGFDGGLWGQAYHVWTEEFIESLADHINGLGVTGNLVEIAAGNGKLSYWLRKKGIEIIATDKNSGLSGLGELSRWRARNKEQEWPVEIMDYAVALRKYQPEFVLASWLLPQNPFEKNSPRIQEAIIDNPSTRFYVEIRGILAGVDCTGICAKRYSQFDVLHPEELQRYSLPMDLMTCYGDSLLNADSGIFRHNLEEYVGRMKTVSSWELKK